MPLKYTVLAHRRVQKLLESQKDPALKLAVLDAMRKLQDYPLSLREMDTEKIKGLERAFRIRAGKFRIIFYVDVAERTVFVTHVEARKQAYQNLR